MSGSIAVADTTVLIGLARLECLEYLSVIFGQVLIPGAVRGEFLAAEKPEDQRPSLALTTLIETPPFESCDDYDSASLAILTSSRLGRGESEGIAQASQRNVPILLTDDRRARIRAMDHGLRVVGTARLLARLARLGLVTDYWSAIEVLRRHGHRIGASVAQAAIDREKLEHGF